jgi:hypothetical protein
VCPARRPCRFGAAAISKPSPLPIQRWSSPGCRAQAFNLALVVPKAARLQKTRALGQPGDPLDGRQCRPRQNPAGNLKPAKDKSTERIDGIVALIMAIGRAVVAQEEPQPAYSMFFV